MIGETLRRLLSGATALLIDFDGPVCSIFGGYPAPAAADDIRESIASQAPRHRGSIDATSDPIALLEWAARAGTGQLIRLVEDALCDAELRAINRAIPTPGTAELLRLAQNRGMEVAVVSNNSPRAISAYLRRAGLDGLVNFVAGRAYASPGLMKPNPDVLHRAMEQLQVKPGACVLIGDTTADIRAARTARVPSIGYANRPAKVEDLANAGAHAIIEDIDTLVDALTDAP